jgi:4-alpha-glucanotransferase
MDTIDTREWLLTNGLGGFASGTVADVHTRTYHGWLFAALEPPGHRTLLLSRIDAAITIAGQTFELGTNFWKSGAIAPWGYKLLQSFTADPVPTWVWGNDQWQLTRQILMPHGLTEPDYGSGHPQWCNRVLVRYAYTGPQDAVLVLRPLIGDRNFHHQQQASPHLHISQLLEAERLLLQVQRQDWVGTPWQLCWNQGNYHPEECWYQGYRYPMETSRGVGDTEDLYNPGYLRVPLQPGTKIILEARARVPDPVQPYGHLHDQLFDQLLQAEQHRMEQQFLSVWATPAQAAQDTLWHKLLKAGDQFIAYRQSINGPTVIAGYPWFSDWGRDTLIALPGLALATQRPTLAKGLLATFGHYCRDGLLPNTFPDEGSHPFYNSLDASLWWIETLGLYLEATQDWTFLQEQYPVVQRIYKNLVAGTAYNIHQDAFDGLLSWDTPGVALTWMDVVLEGDPITPRRGKAIEINALWYSALCWAMSWAEHLQQTPGQNSDILINHLRHYAQKADQVRTSMQKFWNPNRNYFYDVLEPDDHRDDRIRPNGIIALSLKHCAFSEEQGQQALQVAREHLLTPYGLRSLAPGEPGYTGRYQGGVEERDRAYHQGTVWSWLLGPFIRAWQRCHPSELLPVDWRPMLHHLHHEAGLGSISEIFDGDPPHTPRGAIAQAWSVAELIRHWDVIDPKGNFRF